jgi:hypothetical protein
MPLSVYKIKHLCIELLNLAENPELFALKAILEKFNEKCQTKNNKEL